MDEGLETRRSVPANLLDIEKLCLEAQNRWLSPAEICQILRNYKKLRIAPEPPNKPPSGSLFLFDRKVVRNYRKDGHKWSRKNNGKLAKEGHKKLKVEKIEVLHCYYALGEENENFQRRCYSMIEKDFSNIVLVHYLEVTGRMEDFSCVKETEGEIPHSQETEKNMPNSEIGGSMSSGSCPNNCPELSEKTDMCLNSAQAIERENALSVDVEYNHKVSFGFDSGLGLRHPAVQKIDAGGSDPYIPPSNPNPGIDLAPTQSDKGKSDNESEPTDKVLSNSLDFGVLSQIREESKASVEDSSSLSQQPMDQKLYSDSQEHPDIRNYNFFDSGANSEKVENENENDVSSIPFEEQLDIFIRGPSLSQEKPEEQSSGIHISSVNLDNQDNVGRGPKAVQNISEISTTALRLGNTSDALSLIDVEKFDAGKSDPYVHQSYSNCFGGKLPAVPGMDLAYESQKYLDVTDLDESHMQSSAGADWETVENENGIDVSSIPSEGKTNTFMLGPSLSPDQLFSIVDFSPNWTYVGSETEVLIRGRFLKSPDIIENCKWSCMFGEVEVAADVVADGVLRCYTPTGEPGWVHFYVTCSNRLACSEVRVFEYRVSNSDQNNSGTSKNILLRFDKLLTLSSSFNSLDTRSFDDISELSSKINSLLKEDTLGRDGMFKEGGLHQKQLKEKLRVWLLQKVAEGGKGLGVLDEGGQGVLHFAAALGYDWAFEPTILAGVNVHFRDVNGWTALHWAASCGRENTVASLISLGAAPEALAEPSPKCPLGRTPADLASANGHEGIVECLRKRPMGVPNSFSNLDNQVVGRGPKAAQNISEISTTAPSSGNTSDGQSREYSRIYGADETLPMSKRFKFFMEYGCADEAFLRDDAGIITDETLPLARRMSKRWSRSRSSISSDSARVYLSEGEGQLRDSTLVWCLPGLMKAWKRLRLCFGHVRKCCNY